MSTWPPTTNTHLIAAQDTGSTAVLTGLRCSDRAIWHDAVDLRMRTVSGLDADTLRGLIAALDGPTIYDTLVAERGGVK